MKIDLKKYNAFFFDFDGVIVDSLDIKTRAFGELFAKYGKVVSGKVMEYHRNNGGVSRYEKFKHYYKNLLHKDINARIIKNLDSGYSRLVVKKVIAAPYMRGALPLLNRLNRLGKDCFVISGTPVKEIRHILRKKKIAPLFRDCAGSPADKSGNLKRFLAEYGIDPKQAVYFGDSKNDLIAARDNKVFFIGLVPDGNSELKKVTFKPKLKDLSRISV